LRPDAKPSRFPDRTVRDLPQPSSGEQSSRCRLREIVVAIAQAKPLVMIKKSKGVPAPIVA